MRKVYGDVIILIAVFLLLLQVILLAVVAVRVMNLSIMSEYYKILAIMIITVILCGASAGIVLLRSDGTELLVMLMIMISSIVIIASITISSLYQLWSVADTTTLALLIASLVIQLLCFLLMTAAIIYRLSYHDSKKDQAIVMTPLDEDLDNSDDEEVYNLIPDESPSLEYSSHRRLIS